MLDVTPHTAPTQPSPAISQFDGLHVLRVHGDDYEMGFQHGQYLKSELAGGPVPYFQRYVERMLSAQAGPAVGRALSRALSFTVGRRIAAGFPQHARRALDGLADGAGLKRGELLGAVTMPESYLWVLQQLLRLRAPRLAPRHGTPLMGCTSAVAWGNATSHGRLLHGRNFDYQGVGAWDTSQAIVFHRPADGGPYVSVASAGILFGGITAMNSAGLSLVVHQHMASNALDIGGTPIGITGDQIMRYAKNLDDAQRILDADRPNACWTYVIASAKENAVLCYETTPGRHVGHRFDDELFAYSNFYFDRALADTERELYPSHWRNNLARQRRAKTLLEERRGSVDGEWIARILGDPGDGCRFEQAISQIMTVASVVFDPAQGIVHVATGRAPTANRHYAAFSLGTEAAVSGQRLTGGKLPDDQTGAFDHYRQAYEAYFNDADLVTARRELERARTLQPDQAVYHYVAGLLALHDQDAPTAEQALDRAIALDHPARERRASFHLWRGRARDAQGRHSDAQADYRFALGGDPFVERAAKKNLRRPYRPRRFGIEFALGDVPMP